MKMPKKNKLFIVVWNKVTNPPSKIRAPKEANKGQGLLSTKW